jgi:hypothetical protein
VRLQQGVRSVVRQHAADERLEQRGDVAIGHVDAFGERRQLLQQRADDRAKEAIAKRDGERAARLVLKVALRLAKARDELVQNIDDVLARRPAGRARRIDAGAYRRQRHLERGDKRVDPRRNAIGALVAQRRRLVVHDRLPENLGNNLAQQCALLGRVVAGRLQVAKEDGKRGIDELVQLLAIVGLARRA